MSSPPPPVDPGPPAGAYWRGWPEVQADLRSSIQLVLALAVAGIPAGLAWWGLAPRADFRITEDGPVPIGRPSDELMVADDAVYVLVLAVLGLVAGLVAWQLRRRRGVATVAALGIGAVATSVVAWQLGELLGRGPTEAQLAEVGTVVTTSLSLGSPPAIAVASFMAVLAYVLRALVSEDDGLGRTPGTRHPGEQVPAEAGPPAAGPERPLVDVPPGRPQA